MNGVDTRLKELVEQIAEEYSFEVIEMEIMPDHVHLLLEVDPQFGIHKAVKTIKGKTSRILRQEFHWLTTKLPTRTLGCARFVFNHFLAVRRDECKANHHSLTYVKMSQFLTDLKKREDTSWLSEADSMALQESLRNLDRAYENFFQKRAGYPRFKSKHSRSQSYRTRNQGNGIRIEGNRIKLPKVGLVKIKQSRTFEGRILNATVSRTASGTYFVSLCVEMDKTALLHPNGGRQIGIDVGLKAFYSDSDGNTVASPRPLKSLQRKLRREQRRLSRANCQAKCNTFEK